MDYNKLKYSRGQQIVFAVLACFIIICFVTNWSILKFHSQIENNFAPDSILLSNISSFEAKLDSFEWLHQQGFSPQHKRNLLRERFNFDPNTIDSIDILRLGFHPFMAYNWLQYRRHGGKIYSCQKLKTIYNIDTLLVDSLCKFMSFESIKPITKDTIKYTPKEFFTFELNSADTILLSQLPGIGIGRAKMITNYRLQIGGFYTAEQLKEIENIPDSVIDNLTPYINIELDSIKKIDINKSSIKRLHRHPYITYYQAKAIYNLRWDKQHKGIIADLEELKSIFTQEEFERVKFYLKTE